MMSNNGGTDVVTITDPATLRYVGAWMNSPSITVSMDTSLSEALVMMHDNSVRHLPVVLATGQVCGMIADADIRGAELLHAAGMEPGRIAAALRQRRVYQDMVEQPIVVTASTTLREAALLMLDNKLSGLPVVDDRNVPRGILTEDNLFEALVCYIDQPEREAFARHPRAYDAAKANEGYVAGLPLRSATAKPRATAERHARASHGDQAPTTWAEPDLHGVFV